MKTKGPYNLTDLPLRKISRGRFRIDTNAICELIKVHRQVRLLNFGTWSLRPFKKKGKKITNFQGEEVNIRKMYHLKFTPALAIKNRLYYD